MDKELDKILGDYVVIKAEEDGVALLVLQEAEIRDFIIQKSWIRVVVIAQFTENTSAIKIRGKAKILCRHGEISSGE